MSAVTIETSRWDRFRHALTPREWTGIVSMAGVILLLQVSGGGVLAVFIAPHHYDLGTRGLRHRARAHRVHARHAPRLRRRPHRRHRQHHPQADGRGQAPAVGRVLVLPRPLHHRLRSVPAARLRACGRWPGRSDDDSRRCTDSTGLIGTSVSGVFLYLIGDHQPGGAGRHHQGVPPDAAAAASTRPSWSATSTSAAS